ncbi:MAG: winged helix-turn-helix domain-containing protein [Alphaproteobacteria bacterium]
MLRRAKAAAPSPPSRDGGEAGEVGFSGWRLDLAALRLTAPDGTDVSLSRGEFDLLAAFTRYPRRVLSRDRLLSLTRNREWAPFDRSIDVQVGRLRRNIESDPKRPSLIKTVRGAGYIFTAAVEWG